MANLNGESMSSLGRPSTLPPELRLRIYRNLMRAPGPDREEGFNHCFGSQLLRTCKTIYNESLPVLYGENFFTSRMDAQGLEFSLLDRLFTEIGQRARDQVRHVELAGQWNAINAAQRQWRVKLYPTRSLGSLDVPNLRVVRVRVDLGWRDYASVIDACELFCWEVIVRDEVRPEHFAYTTFGGLRTCRWDITAEAKTPQQGRTATHNFTKIDEYRMRFSFHTDAARFHLGNPPESVAVEVRTSTVYTPIADPLTPGSWPELPLPGWSDWTVAKVLKT